MKTTHRLGLGLLGVTVISAGCWLWLRNGVPVWLEGAVAFCL